MMIPLLTFLWFIIYDQMRRQELRETFDALEEFLLLKRQNCMIYAWMELKKRDRKLVGALSSRAKSILSYRTSYKSCENISRGHQQIYNHFLPSSPNHNTLYKDSPKNHNQYQTHNNQQAKLSTNKSQGYCSPRQREALSRRSIFGIRHQGLEFDENDDFEEIVIERLAKLEQNISKMMHDKQIKEREQSKIACTPSAKHKDRHDQTTVNAQGSKLLYRNRRKRIQGYLSDHQKTPKDTVNHLKEAISNIKYIPVSKLNNAHFQQTNKQNKEQDNIIDDIDYFIVGKIKRRIGSPNKDLRMHDGYQTHSATGNIHFFPNNIDIQTIIEPRNSHFFKNEPDLLFSPIKSKHEQMKSSPKPNKLLKYSSSDPNIFPLY